MLSNPFYFTYVTWCTIITTITATKYFILCTAFSLHPLLLCSSYTFLDQSVIYGKTMWKTLSHYVKLWWVQCCPLYSQKKTTLKIRVSLICCVKSKYSWRTSMKLLVIHTKLKDRTHLSRELIRCLPLSIRNLIWAQPLINNKNCRYTFFNLSRPIFTLKLHPPPCCFSVCE